MKVDDYLVIRRKRKSKILVEQEPWKEVEE